VLTGLLLGAALADPAGAVTVVLGSRIDPVPPGGTIIYTLRVSGGTQGAATGCFNPAPECVTGVASCSIGSPQCVGNSFTGFVCQNAANEGANCGIGDPPIPDGTRCVPDTTGICNGGINAGFPCTSEIDCPGLTFVCVRAFNEGQSCGIGSPPTGNAALCVANPEGYCASGPNFGEICVTDEDCPPEEDAPPDGIIVTLPLPAGTTFVSADKGGVAGLTTVTWSLPPLQPCGLAGLPQCPLVTTELLIDSAAVEGTFIQAQATAGDAGGTTLSNLLKTTVGTTLLRRLVLAYPNSSDRDRLVYRGVFTIPPGASIDPLTDSFTLTIDGASTAMTTLSVAAGELLPTSTSKYVKFRSSASGVARMVLRELAPSHYFLSLAGRKLNMTDLDGLSVTVTLTIGDDTLIHPVDLVVRNGGRAFVNAK
jgi:hypothetical protein